MIMIIFTIVFTLATFVWLAYGLVYSIRSNPMDERTKNIEWLKKNNPGMQ